MLSKEETTKELRRLQAEGHSMRVPEFEPKLYRAILKNFGGYTNAKKELGIKVRRKKGSGGVRRPLDDVLTELRSVLPDITDKSIYINKYAHIMHYSIKHLGDGYEVFRLIGADIPPNKRKYPDKQSIIAAIRRYHKDGVSLHGRNMARIDSSLVGAAIKLFSSWGVAVEESGFDYEKVRETGLSYSPLTTIGEDFEETFAEILTELGYEYIREGCGVNEVVSGFRLKPDFILPNWRWIDCKLSEWTDIHSMLSKYYENNPNGLTVVYLRGSNHRVERGRKYKYEHISVYQFTKDLPEERREYYEEKLRKLEKQANECEAAI